MPITVTLDFLFWIFFTASVVTASCVIYYAARAGWRFIKWIEENL